MADDMFKRLENRVSALEKHADGMSAWRRSVEENTEVQREVVAVGKDIIAAVRVLGWIGHGIKWLAGVAASVAALGVAIKAYLNGIH